MCEQSICRAASENVIFIAYVVQIGPNLAPNVPLEDASGGRQFHHAKKIRLFRLIAKLASQLRHRKHFVIVYGRIGQRIKSNLDGLKFPGVDFGDSSDELKASDFAKNARQ